MSDILHKLAAYNARLADELDRRRRAADAANEGIVTCDAQADDLPIVYCNDGFCRVTGYDREEVLGRNCRFLQCDETSEEALDEIRQAIENAERLTIVLRNQKKNGELFWNELSISPVTDENGEVIEFIGFQRDVSRRVNSERELRRRENDLEKYATIVENATDAVFIVDSEGRFEFVNEQFTHTLGLNKDDIEGLHPDEIDAIEEGQFGSFDRLTPHSDDVDHREHMVTIRGDNHIFSTTQVPIYSDTTRDDERRKIIGISRDISEQKELQRELKQQALYDELTGLPNRTLFRDRLRHAISRARRDQFFLSVAFVDIDDFKAINDSLGHAAGDQVLIEVAKRLRATLRSSDTVARLGGDEFMLLLESTGGQIDFDSIGEHIRQALHAPLELEGTDVPISLSIGFAYPKTSRLKQTPVTNIRESLVRAADRAMYRAKQQADTSWTIVNACDSGESSRRVQRENDIRRGLESDEFLPYFQPIFSLPSEKLVAMEVLARWQHPERGLVNPASFIPLAEKSTLICDLGEYILEKACQLAKAAAPLTTDQRRVPLYVNLSPRQLDHCAHIDALTEIVDSYSPDISVGFEVTESQLLERAEPLERIRRQGIDIIVDDFGSGYSSFERLKEIEIDALKLDMRFVQGALTNEEDAAIAETVATLGERLNIPVIGEGVESVRHLQFLKDAGFRAAQGFHLGRPRVLDDMLEELPVDEFGRPPTSLVEDTVPETR